MRKENQLMADTEKEFDFFSFLEENDDLTQKTPEKDENRESEEVPAIPEKQEEVVVVKEAEEKSVIESTEDTEVKAKPVEDVEVKKKEETTVVEEPKSEKKTKKSKSKSEPTPEPQAAFQHTDVKFNLESVNFKNVTEKFVPSVSEDGDEWETIKAEIQKDLTKLDFGENELEPGAIRVKIKELVALYNKVKDLEAEYVPLLDTVQDIINRMKVTNSVGANPESRKKNGLESCETFKVQGLRGTVNLYDYEIIIRYRKEYLASALDRIRNAKDCLDLYVRSYFAEKK